MVRRSFTAVIEKNSTFTEPFETEPYETGWATEARWFLRVMQLRGTLAVTPQVSPDGLFWCDEGRAPLSIAAPGLYSFRAARLRTLAAPARRALGRRRGEADDSPGIEGIARMRLPS